MSKTVSMVSSIQSFYTMLYSVDTSKSKSKLQNIKYDLEGLNPYPVGEWIQQELTNTSNRLEELGTERTLKVTSANLVGEEETSSDEENKEDEEDLGDGHKRDIILRGPIWNYGMRKLSLDIDYYNHVIFGDPFPRVETPENMIFKGEKWTSFKPITSSLGIFLLKKFKKLGFEKTALVEFETGRTLSYGEFACKAESLACGLHWRGVQSGQIVGIVSYHSLEAHILILACFLIGAVAALIDSSLNAVEFGLVMRTTDLHWLFTEVGKTLDMIVTVMENLELVMHHPKPQLIINSTKLPESTKYSLFHQLFREVDPLEPTPGPRKADPLRPVLILYTGSPDKMKACLISERYFTKSKAFEDTVLPASDEPSITVMITPPMYCARAIKGIFNHYVAGQRIILCRGLIPVPCLITALRKFEVFGILTIRDTLLALLDWPARPRCPQLKLVVVTGLPLRLKNLTRVYEELFRKQSIILQLYGLVETGTTAANTFFNNKHGSVGKLFHNIEMKVLEEGSGIPLGINEEGELCVRSPTMMLEYYNNPEANKESIDSEGFLHTGDLGYYDEQGFVHVTDRVCEIIKWRTYLVSPSTIEEVLLELPEVNEALVFGLFDDKEGELVSAAIVLEIEHENADMFALEKKANALLPFHRRIRGGLYVFDEFPRSTIGKPMKAHVVRDVIERMYKSRKISTV